jgi:outer membrane protein assembly factor BamB
MSNDPRPGRRLGDLFDDIAPSRAPDRLRRDVFTSIDRVRPRPRWLALIKESPMRVSSRVAVGSPTYRLAVIVALTLLLSVAASAGVLAGAALLQAPPSVETGEWPMLRADAARRGQGQDGPRARPVLRWRYQAGGSADQTVSVVGGLVYATSDDGTLRALDIATGNERWSYAPEVGPVGNPNVFDGRVVATDMGGHLVAVDAMTGSESWRSEGVAFSSDATFDGDTLYIGAADGTLVALDASSGAVRWTVPVSTSGGEVWSPAFADGRLYVSERSGDLVAVDVATREIAWRVPTGSSSTGTAVVADGIVFLGTYDGFEGSLSAFDGVTGRLLWSVAEPLWAPAVSDGVAYSGGEDVATAHSATTGRELWRFELDGVVRAPAVADGIVYVPAESEHRVYALEAASGRVLWSYDVDGQPGCCVSIAHGSAFFGTVTGGVYSIGADGSAAGA